MFQQKERDNTNLFLFSIKYHIHIYCYLCKNKLISLYFSSINLVYFYDLIEHIAA